MLRQTVYDAFTKISLKEKTNIITFLRQNSEDNINKNQVSCAIDAAVKEIPSFGGFIITISDGETILSAIIVNHTGMESFGPSHIVSFFAVHADHKNIGIEHKLLKYTLSKTTGNTIFQTKEGHPHRALFFEVGFQESGIQMRFEKSKNNSPKKRKATTSKRVTA